MSRKAPANKPKATKKSMNVTPTEQVLEYRVSLARQYLADLEFKKHKLLESISRQQELNEVIIDEGKSYTSAAKEHWDAFRSATTHYTIESTAVTDYMKETWSLKAIEEDGVRVVREEIQNAEKEIEEAEAEVQKWIYFVEVTKQQNEERITQLKDNINDMSERFCSILESMMDASNRKRMNCCLQIEKQYSNLNQEASGRVIEYMDKRDARDARSQKWLQKEHDVREKELKETLETLNALEEENLHIQSHLYQCSLPQLSNNVGPTNNWDVSINNLQIIQVPDLRFKQWFENIMRKGKPTLYGSNIVKSREAPINNEYDGYLQEENIEANTWKQIDFQQKIKSIKDSETLLCVMGNMMPIREQKEDVDSSQSPTKNWPVTSEMLAELMKKSLL